MRRDVPLDGRLVAGERARTDARTRHIANPQFQELSHGLPLVRDQSAILGRFKGISERIGYFASGSAVEGLVLALAGAPAQIDARHPSAIGALHDASFSLATPACTHHELRPLLAD